MKWYILVSMFTFVSFYNNSKVTDMITHARKAARQFCVKNNFPAEKIREIDKKPVLSVSTQKDGRAVHIYRWLGGGRGGYYVQVEVYKDKQEMMVHGSDGKKEFEPETYPIKNEP